MAVIRIAYADPSRIRHSPARTAGSGLGSEARMVRRDVCGGQGGWRWWGAAGRRGALRTCGRRARWRPVQ
eukprot:715392-Rhodomonas_salina.1